MRLSLEYGSEPEGRLSMSLTVMQASVVLGEACDGGCIMSFEGVHSDLYAACGNDCQLLLAIEADGLKDVSVFGRSANINVAFLWQGSLLPHRQWTSPSSVQLLKAYRSRCSLHS